MTNTYEWELLRGMLNDLIVKVDALVLVSNRHQAAIEKQEARWDRVREAFLDEDESDD